MIRAWTSLLIGVAAVSVAFLRPNLTQTERAVVGFGGGVVLTIGLSPVRKPHGSTGRAKHDQIS